MRFQEVGDESRLARSFERIRSIIRKKRMVRQRDGAAKMEEVVEEVIQRKRTERYKTKKHGVLKTQQTTLYRRSYEVDSFVQYIISGLTV